MVMDDFAKGVKKRGQSAQKNSEVLKWVEPKR